jgi:DNA-nicking Smr family endonuclease
VTDMNIILKWSTENYVVTCRLDLHGLSYEPAAFVCEHGDEIKVP